MSKARLEKLEAAISNAAEKLATEMSALGIKVDNTFLASAIETAVSAARHSKSFVVTASTREPVEHNTAADLIVAAYANYKEPNGESTAVKFVKMALESSDMPVLIAALNDANRESAVGQLILSEMSEDEESEDEDSEDSDEDSDDEITDDESEDSDDEDFSEEDVEVESEDDTSDEDAEEAEEEADDEEAAEEEDEDDIIEASDKGANSMKGLKLVASDRRAKALANMASIKGIKHQ